MVEDIVTYDDIAKWIPARVREAIELSVPCAGGHDHLWDHYRKLRVDTGQYVTIAWVCVHCRIQTTTDPRSLDEQTRPLASANLEDFL